MESKASLYLHFARFDKLNSWEIKFTHSFGLIIQQLFGQPAMFYCNCDIPGTTYCNPENLANLKQCTAYLIIFNFPTATELKDSELLTINSVMEYLTQHQKKNICLINRYYKRKNPLSEKFAKHATFNFFELNAKTQEIIDFKSDTKEDKDNNYWLKITDLAYVIKSFAEEATSSHSRNYSRKQTIYLAESSVDQLKSRDRLRRDLQLSGYYVIPEKPLPKDTADFGREVKALLDQSVLSINMMGELYGECPTGSDYSYQELQNRYFSEVYISQLKDGKQPIRRIIWSPPLFEPYEEKQVQYLKRLNREINTTDNTDIVQSTVYDLITLIEGKIQTLSIKEDENKNDNDTLLFISDNYSDFTTRQLLLELEKRNIPYALLNKICSLTGNDLEKIMENIGKYHHNLILLTRQENLWIHSILALLTRSRGYEKAVPAGKTGLFCLGNGKKHPDFFPLTIEPYVINNVNLSQQLESFISKIKA